MWHTSSWQLCCRVCRNDGDRQNRPHVRHEICLDDCWIDGFLHASSAGRAKRQVQTNICGVCLQRPALCQNTRVNLWS